MFTDLKGRGHGEKGGGGVEGSFGVGGRGGRLIPQCILCKTVSLTSNGKLLVI